MYFRDKEINLVWDSGGKNDVAANVPDVTEASCDCRADSLLLKLLRGADFWGACEEYLIQGAQWFLFYKARLNNYAENVHIWTVLPVQ